MDKQITKEEIKRLKDIIVEFRQSHHFWLDCFEKYPEKSSYYAENVGTAEHHRKCIKKYNEALEIVDRLINALETVGRLIGSLEKAWSEYRL